MSYISDSEENENVLTGCYENEPQYTEFERTYENKFKPMKHFNNKYVFLTYDPSY